MGKSSITEQSSLENSHFKALTLREGTGDVGSSLLNFDVYPKVAAQTPREDTEDVGSQCSMPIAPCSNLQGRHI